MVNVIVAGLPKNVKLQKFILFMKKTVLKTRKSLYVNYYKLISDTIKQVSVSTKYNEALKAKQFLDGYTFVHANTQYPLECWLENLDEDAIEYQPERRIPPDSEMKRDEDRAVDYEPPYQPERRSKQHLEPRRDDDRAVDYEPPYQPERRSKQHLEPRRDDDRAVDYEPPYQPERRVKPHLKPRRDEDRAVDYEPPQKSRRYSNSPVRMRSRSRSRLRSPSPHQSDELRQIELKIELIRKQRILMEEETKLLLEKRKLEYLQNFGSNENSGKLAKFEEVNQANDASEISEFLAFAEPKKAKAKKLPGFLGPCKAISAQMKPTVKAHEGITFDNASIFWNLLRATVKKRLTIIMEGKNYMPTEAIIGLYRARHPIATDRSFVDELLNTINTSIWPGCPKKAELAADESVDFTADVKAELAPDVSEGQSAEAEKPPAELADVEEVDLTGIDEQENQASEDANDLVDLDVDMENDFENWDDDDEKETSTVQETADESFDKGESIAVADDVTEVAQGNSADEQAVAETTESAFEEVDEAVLIVDDADKFRESEKTDDAGEGQTSEEKQEQ